MTKKVRITLEIDNEFIRQLRINCTLQHLGNLREEGYRQHTAMQILGLITLMEGMGCLSEQIEAETPPEWRGHITSLSDQRLVIEETPPNEQIAGLAWFDVEIMPGWSLIDRGIDGFRCINKTERLSVIFSVAIQSDKKRWIHVSLARENRMPNYYDIKNVKEAFLPGLKAIMILPEDDKFVNLHPYCLHLFHSPDGDGLPEFSGFRRNINEGKLRTL